jgi:transposase
MGCEDCGDDGRCVACIGEDAIKYVERLVEPPVPVDNRAGAAFAEDLNVVLHTLSEGHQWRDDVDSMSKEQAVLVWRAVEAIRKRSFPERLRI